MEVIKKHLKDLNFFKAEDNTLLAEVFHPKNGESINLPYSLAFATIDPGNSSLKHSLKQEELYIFIKGKGQIYIDQEKHEVEEGMNIIVPAGAIQWVKNNSEETLAFYCIVSPPWTASEEIIL
jgi:mannose-6-phosphate isomerase-like protein (cupin superfamily)